MWTFNEISKVWERAGLDFKTTALLFTPPGQTPEEKETGATFKVLAGRSLVPVK